MQNHRGSAFAPFIRQPSFQKPLSTGELGFDSKSGPHVMTQQMAPEYVESQGYSRSNSSNTQDMITNESIDVPTPHLTRRQVQSPEEESTSSTQASMARPSLDMLSGNSISTSGSQQPRWANTSSRIVQSTAEQPLFRDWPTAQSPVIMNKPSLQNVVFKQPVSVRFLKPPTPPPPGPVVIRERRPAAMPSLPPQIIRQRLPRARTPEPLVIRERPPTPPKAIKPVLIEKVLPAPPRPPRQIIVERFHEPRRPRKLIFEKWLPYKQPKRKIILEKAPDIPMRPPPRNIIIEYTRPQAFMLPEYKVEGIFQADPLTYTYSPYDGELKVVEKIYDLPPPPNVPYSGFQNPRQSEQFSFSTVGSGYFENPGSSIQKTPNNPRNQ